MSMANTRSQRRPVTVLDGFPGLFARVRISIATAIARRRKYRQTLHELRGLSDRDLGDVGIPRADIARIARETADRI